MTRYFKATNSRGHVEVRSSESRVYDKAFIPDNGGRSNWASAGNVPPESRRRKGEICPAVEITRKEYREILGG